MSPVYLILMSLLSANPQASDSRPTLSDLSVTVVEDAEDDTVSVTVETHSPRGALLSSSEVTLDSGEDSAAFVIGTDGCLEGDRGCRGARSWSSQAAELVVEPAAEETLVVIHPHFGVGSGDSASIIDPYYSVGSGETVSIINPYFLVNGEEIPPSWPGIDRGVNWVSISPIDPYELASGTDWVSISPIPTPTP